MRRRRLPGPEPARDDVDAALATLSAEDLREIVRALLLELDDKDYGRVASSLIQHAARSGGGWTPAALGDAEVAEAVSFAKAAAHGGQADPSAVDEYLRRGATSFLRKDYAAAHQIFDALLRPMGEGEIDLGQDEMVDEVLGADINECAAQYVVSAYMLAPSDGRADAVRAAIDAVQGVAHFWEPIREMERAAIEPLPGMDAFLPMWRALLVRKVADARKSDWDTDEDRWLREVVKRLEGANGLAKVARSSRRADDLRAWCRSLVDARDWKAAHSAFEEAANLVADKEYARAELLDGAALAAQELGRADLPEWLERAWRAAPSMTRLRRWLGVASSKAEIRRRASEALESCPKDATRQRAFLHVLQGDLEPAAKLLAAAPGLGWSHGEHPGHLLFPLFAGLLGGTWTAATRYELDLETCHGDEPQLVTPEVDAILRQAGVDRVSTVAARSTVLAAMRRAAERRLAGVTDQKRRRHYGQAAELVAACVGCDGSPETARWAASLTSDYRRFPALRAELDRALGTS